MKKYFLTLMTIITPIIYLFGQDFSVSVTKEGEPSEKITILNSDDIDDYEVSVYLAATKEKIDGMKVYSIEQKYFINGKETPLDLWSSLSKESDGTALKADFDIGDIIEEKPGLMKEKENVFKVVFIDESGAEIAQAEIKFDVPGFNDYKSKFCGELFTIRSDDDAAKMVKSLFTIVYPDAEILEVLMDDEWNISESHGGHNSYMIIFKDKGKLKFIKYSAMYSLEDGVLMTRPKVRIYNGFIDGWNLASSCYENLKTVLK